MWRSKQVASRWVEAAKLLAADPAASVRCPEKDDGNLRVHDEVFANDPTAFERHLVCESCGARNILRMRR